MGIFEVKVNRCTITIVPSNSVEHKRQVAKLMYRSARKIFDGSGFRHYKVQQRCYNGKMGITIPIDCTKSEAVQLINTVKTEMKKMEDMNKMQSILNILTEGCPLINNVIDTLEEN